jgi:hypothetical protein
MKQFCKLPLDAFQVIGMSNPNIANCSCKILSSCFLIQRLLKAGMCICSSVLYPFNASCVRHAHIGFDVSLPWGTRPHPATYWPPFRDGDRWTVTVRYPRISWESSFLGTLTDINQWINHWLWRRSIFLHSDPVGGTWRGGSLTGDFEGLFEMHIWVPSFWNLSMGGSSNRGTEKIT